MSIRIPRQKVEALFNILKKTRSGRWKNKTEASRKLGISRPTIDKILEMYPDGMPQKPKKMIPKYYADFDETEMAKKITNYYWDTARQGRSDRGEQVYSCAREASHILAVMKGQEGVQDLMYADENDYAVFWGTPDKSPHPDFVDPQTNKIYFGKASMLRMCMRLAGTQSSIGGNLIDDPRFDTRDLKRESGRHKKHYLTTEMIINVIGQIREVDTLILFFLGVLFGGRFSAFAGKRTRLRKKMHVLGGLKVEDIDYEAQIIELSEPKIKKTAIEKDLPTPLVLELLTFYIKDFKIKGRLFKWTIGVYNNRLKKAGREANVPFPLTTHKLKHTAITQMSLHGVDVDVIEDYVETDAKTIKDFYRGGGRKKIQQQIKGLKRKVVQSWSEYIEELMPYVLERYNYLKPFCVAEDGISLKK